jgi:hypothetical protein
MPDFVGYQRVHQFTNEEQAIRQGIHQMLLGGLLCEQPGVDEFILNIKVMIFLDKDENKLINPSFLILYYYYFHFYYFWHHISIDFNIFLMQYLHYYFQILKIKCKSLLT